MSDQPVLPRYPRTSVDLVVGRPTPTRRFRVTFGTLMVLALSLIAASVALLGSTLGRRDHRGQVESSLTLQALGIAFLVAALVYLLRTGGGSRRPGGSA